MSKPYKLEVPGIRVSQGGKEMLLISLLWSQLERFITTVSHETTLERAQRDLNLKRAKNFTDYLRSSYLNKTPMIVPSLIGNCDGEYEIEEVGNTNMVMVRFTLASRIELFDGQHRARGIVDYVRENFDVRHYQIGIHLTLNEPLTTRKQFFSDINNNASKPAASINMAYDSKNKLSQMLIGILEKSPLGQFVDYEHNAVPAKSDKWVSYKALYDASKKMIANRPESDTPAAMCEDLECYWNAWYMLTDLEGYAKTCKSGEFRKEYLTFHAVTVNAFGWAVFNLLESMPVRDVVRAIEQLAMQATNSEGDSYFEYANWKNICVDPERLTIKADVAAQKKAGLAFAQSISSGKMLIELSALN